ncbi:MAG TPA: class I SAM-dependent methyltransferase [Pyrinomonadaceae bacterium]|nr:class I SAM-dependent methyltransferase [Pyrinomonadaceae bacterium]
MSSNWWETFFHGVALDFWRAAVSEEQTRGEADFLQQQMQLPPGAKVLDVPCGNGRLSIELAKRGFKLTAVDQATEFIAEGQKTSEQAGVAVDWQLRDMRDLPWTSKFDGAFCFGNSFGYLDDDANARFLQSVAKTLRPGAKFVLDNGAIAECLLPVLQERRTLECGGITLDSATRYDHTLGRIFTDYTFIRDEISDTRPASQRVYTYRETTSLLTEAGLDPVAAFGSITAEPFKFGAQRLFLLAEKR